MIDFYRTQNLRKHFRGKRDLLAVIHIVIQYDPVNDAILITDVGPEEYDGLFSTPFLLEPKSTILPMLVGPSHGPWVEPAIGTVGEAVATDYFRERGMT